MSARARFAAFVAALVAAFALSFAVGSAFDLRDDAPAEPTPHMEMP